MCARVEAFLALLSLLMLMGCGGDEPGVDPPKPERTFYFGADLSYVNQILDHNGVYKVNSVTENPYKIFKDKGTGVVRLRLWHNPAWTKEVYGAEGTQLYNDLADVERAIQSSKAQGMAVLLDFHYSDRWADPGQQEVPAAWVDITEISVLEDSVYNYTFKVLNYLEGKNLLPEFVQIGNETNCGMLYEFESNPVPTFPSCYGCDGEWGNLRKVVNSAIDAVRDVSATSEVKTKILLHVADPVNVEYFFDNLTSGGEVTDYDMIGFSYYPLWHTGVPLSQLSNKVTALKAKYNKDIVILETGYPWTTAGDDSYTNIFGGQTPVSGFPFTKEGQLAIMKSITQEMLDGGGIGMFYWEPGWISSDMKDLWGTGSSWENVTFFDFAGNATSGFDYMTHEYD